MTSSIRNAIALSSLWSSSVGAQPPATSAAPSARAVYQEHDRAAAAAREKGDWVAFRIHVRAADSVLNAHPQLTMNLARAAARVGDSTEALTLLGDLIAAGLTRDISADSAFLSLRGSAKWAAIQAQLGAKPKTIGPGSARFTLMPADLIAEDIAYDPCGRRFLVTSVRHRKVLAIDRAGKVSDFLPAAQDRWGMLAIAVDSTRSRVWVTTYAIPQMNGYIAATDSGKTAILRLDLATGAVQKLYSLPADALRHEPGDIRVAENGDLFISDGRSGALSVIRNATDTVSVLVAPGQFFSPQGPALSPDGKHLYVADYARGIAEVDRTSGKLRWLAHPRSIAISGIDGLTMLGSNRLLAVQNGTTPNRLLELRIDPAQARVTSARVIAQDSAAIDEPTHGVIVASDFYFIANGGFGAFDDKGQPRPGVTLKPPVILSIPVSALQR